MAEKTITRLNVGSFSISIIGIAELMKEMAETHTDTSDEAVRAYMLERLEQENYIPGKAREDYGRAFLREYRKFMGQPFTDDAPKGLDIKVLGVGCSQCHALAQIIMEVLTELKLPAGVDHVTDIKEIARYGVMGSPALVINSKAVAVGSVPPRDKIKKWLIEANASSAGK